MTRSISNIFLGWEYVYQKDWGVSTADIAMYASYNYEYQDRGISITVYETPSITTCPLRPIYAPSSLHHVQYNHPALTSTLRWAFQFETLLCAFQQCFELVDKGACNFWANLNCGWFGWLIWSSPLWIEFKSWIDLHPRLGKGGVWFYSLLSDPLIEKPPTPNPKQGLAKFAKPNSSRPSRLWPSLHPRPESHFPHWPKCPPTCLVCMERAL